MFSSMELKDLKRVKKDPLAPKPKKAILTKRQNDTVGRQKNIGLEIFPGRALLRR